MIERASFASRIATTGDGPRLGEIYLQAVRQAMPWLRLTHGDDELKAWFSREMPRSHQIWVGERHGSVRAFIALSLDRAWIDHLYVEPEAQGSGHGRELLEVAKSGSPGQLRLWAFQRNLAARTFYEHRGFTALEFTGGRANLEREPDVLYRWNR
ncbi:MAG: GNAT family N-acetyltransferase [Candidatus Dormibacteria bacterium]